MRSELRRLMLLPLVAHLGACAGQEGQTGSIRVTEWDSAGIKNVQITGSVEELPIWEVASMPVTEVSGDAAPYLGSVGEVAILSDGSLLVEDNQTAELRRFTSAGEEAQLLGGSGEGPGEFQNLTELNVTAGDTAYAYDRRLYRISRFDPDGTLGYTTQVGRERAGPHSLVLDAWGVDSEHLVLHSLGPFDHDFDGQAYRDQREAVLHLVDEEGRDLVSPVRFRGGYSIAGQFGDIRAPFANEPFVSVGQGRILHGSGIRYELVVRSSALRPVRVIRWEGWEEPLSDSLLQAVHDSIKIGLEPLREARPDLAEQVLEALFDPELLPDTMPAIRSAMLDDRGRIWISAFRPTTETWLEEEAWHILDSLGAPLARVRLPPSARLAAVRGNRVALVVRDTVEVEHVRVFELVPSR